MTDEQRVLLGLSHPYQCEAEIIHGPEDGFRFTLMRKSKPYVGLKKIMNGNGYRLCQFKSGIAQFYYVPNK